MDGDTMKALGKILGELYRLQRRIDPQMVGVGDATIYGLVHGSEDVLPSELNIRDEDGSEIGVSSAEVRVVVDILSEYWRGEKPMLTGFYEIESQLKQAGIDRMKAKQILTYLKV